MKSGLAVAVGCLLLLSICAAGGVFSPDISGQIRETDAGTESPSDGRIRQLSMEHRSYQAPSSHAELRDRQRLLHDGDTGGLSLAPRLVRAYVHTTYAGVEKNMSLLDAVLQPINADNNDETGENGNDFRVRFFPFPDIGQQDVGWVLALSAVLEVERLGEMPGQEAFDIELYLHLSLDALGYGEHTIRLGYSSADGDTIPEREQIIFTVAPYVFYDHAPVFAVTHAPSFDGEPGDITLHAGYDATYRGDTHHHAAQITYAPAVAATAMLTPHLDDGRLDLSLSRSASRDTVITLGYQGELNGRGTDITLTIDALPAEMAFSLGYDLSDATGSLVYESSSEFNVTLTVRMDRLDLMGVMQVRYLPTMFQARWTPRLRGGHVNVSTTALRTKLILADDIDDPALYFAVSNMTTDLSLGWDIDRDGSLQMDTATAGPHVEFWWKKDAVSLETDAWLRATSLSMDWRIENDGHVNVDTGDEWLSTYTLNFTIDDAVGLRLMASLLRADMFRAAWTVWPPSFDLSGSIELTGNITFAVMLNGDWYDVVSGG
jgi:hypothetical protein